MTRHERIAAAAARYGMTEPSPDDVLMEHWTRYNDDAIHTRGYHEDYAAVMKAIGAAGPPRCACGATLKGRSVKRGICSKCNRERYYAKYKSSPLEGDAAEEAIYLYEQGGHGLDVIAGLLGVGSDRVRVTLKAAHVKLRGVRGVRTKGIRVRKWAA
jgi:transposase-like protein